MNAISIGRAVAARDLAVRLASLLRSERAALADFLVALAAFDRQRGWRDLGYAGLFPFLHRHLRLSKAAAFFRKTAAELLQRFPEIVEPLRDGRLCLTSVVELSKVLTPSNKEVVLPRFFYRSKQEAKAVAAELKPEQRPAQRAVVTTLALCTRPSIAAAERNRPDPGEAAPKSGPGRGITLDTTTGRPSADETRPVGIGADPSGTEPLPGAERPRDAAQPLTAELRRLHVTVTQRFLDKLEAARCALSHSLPGASIEAVLEAALDLVLAKEAKKRGPVPNPRPTRAEPREPGARYVPAAVRRAVWERDGGKCQWVLDNGEICGSTYQVEVDHTRPVGQGGRSTIEGTRLLCKPHNDLAARLAYGDAWMDRFTRGMSRRVGARDPGDLPREPLGDSASGAGPP